MDTEIVGHLSQRHTGIPILGYPDHVVTELQGIRLGHTDILSRPASASQLRCHLHARQSPRGGNSEVVSRVGSSGSQ
jgi:hypothetical protein